MAAVNAECSRSTGGRKESEPSGALRSIPHRALSGSEVEMQAGYLDMTCYRMTDSDTKCHTSYRTNQNAPIPAHDHLEGEMSSRLMLVSRRSPFGRRDFRYLHIARLWMVLTSCSRNSPIAY